MTTIQKMLRRPSFLIGGTLSVLALILGGAIVGGSISSGGSAATPSPASTTATSADAGPTPSVSDAESESPTPAPAPTSTRTATPRPASSSSPQPRADTHKAHASSTSKTGTALALLATIPVKGRAPMTGYDRVVDFGSAWRDVDGNGCDTRDDILARDLTGIVRAGTCKVLSGTLVDPYTGRTIHFHRGVRTSTAVQIDHMVALADAWQTGARQISATARLELANDPLNLLAVDGATNESKGAGDAATWLPPVKRFRCTYVARQISVKAEYHLWVTPAEHDAMIRILDTCPGQKAGTSARVAAPVTRSQPAPKPAPAKRKVVHPGSFCSPVGVTGVTATGTPMRCSSKDGKQARWRSP